MYGVGPACVYSMALFALAGIILHCKGYLDSGHVPALTLPFRILGILLIAAGVTMWCKAVFGAKIDKNILENHLVITGIYAWVRNPIYSAIAIAMTGLCLLFVNLWLLFLPFFFWLDITLFMIFSEEKWLRKLYGEEYLEYCRHVNRCIPWFPKK